MPTKRPEKQLYERPRLGNVFDWLDEVRKRPSMWIGASETGGLRVLDAMVWGYHLALGVHHVDEGVPQMGHFSDWLALKKRWGTSLGWAYAIEEHARRKSADPLDVFFQLIDAYRKLRPVVRCHVNLTAEHTPTGMRSTIGGRLLPPPLRIEVVQYQPARLLFLRFEYPEGAENQPILGTTLTDAKRWAEDEFQIQRDEWIRGR